MKFPRPTIRRLMLAILAVALLLWTATVATRWADYRHRAIQDEETARVLEGEVDSLRRQGGRDDQVVVREEARAKLTSSAAAYRRAMWRPWSKIVPPEQR